VVLVCDLSKRVICNDLEWPWSIISATRHLSVSNRNWLQGALLELLKHLGEKGADLKCQSLRQQAVRDRPPQYATAPTSWPFDIESGVRVTCDVGYLCANFSLPRPLCFPLRPDVRDRQTDVRRVSSLNASAVWGRGIIKRWEYVLANWRSQ